MSLNRFEFMGRLIKDPEVRRTTIDTQVTVFTLAVDRKYVGQYGNRETDFFNLTAFGKTAEFISKYFRKGRQVLVEGRIQNRTWEDKYGAKKYVTDFIVEQCYFADSKITSENGVNNQDNGEYITIDDTTMDLPF